MEEFWPASGRVALPRIPDADWGAIAFMSAT